MVMRQIFPFWGFTKAVANYALTYPMDHPIRAAFMANSQRIIDQDRDGRLPEVWDKYLGLGEPDPVTGEEKIIPLTSLNPFASQASMMTAAGILSRLNPVFGGALQALFPQLDLNNELYPQLTYNPATGGLVVQQPGIFGRLTNAISIFPQVDAAAQIFQLTAQDKAEAATNPQAYLQSISQKLGLPLGMQLTGLPGSKELPLKAPFITPEEQSPSAAIVKSEADKWTALQDALTEAKTQGSVAPLTPYLPGVTNAQLQMLGLLQLINPRQFSDTNMLWLWVMQERAKTQQPLTAGPWVPAPTGQQSISLSTSTS